jgi:hypothetical protein
MTLAEAFASAAAPRREIAPDEAGAAVPTWPILAVLFASTCIVVGLIWDISWHRSVGRDTLWTAPHVVEQVGAAVSGLACGWLVLRTTFAGSAAQRAAGVGFWGFRGPLGAWTCIWGTLMMMMSVPFDDWWHAAYGLDVKIISPPHVVLAAGMMAILVGALVMVLAAQNRDAGGTRAPLRLAYVYAAGVLLTMMVTITTEYTGLPNRMHGALFYMVSAGAFCLILAGVARAGRLRWPATATALVYMGVVLVMAWILEVVPATPKLAPIYNPITRMVPPSFPLLLVVPALLFDVVVTRFRGRRDWALAAVLGIAFVAAMLAVHWPWSEFLLSPAARNGFFLADRWDYMLRLGDWRYEFWDAPADGPGAFARGMAIAAALGILSSRLGLAWGSWMERVRR